jgi:hypothetical protein
LNPKFRDSGGKQTLLPDKNQPEVRSADPREASKADWQKNEGRRIEAILLPSLSCQYAVTRKGLKGFWHRKKQSGVNF